MTHRTIFILIGASVVVIILTGLIATFMLRRFGISQKKDEPVCAQIITQATNPKTGETKEFPTPCDVPKGWQIVAPQSIEETSSPNGKLQFDQPGRTADPFSDQNGPFYHQILKATSADGLNFTKIDGVVFDKASVPDIIRLESGRLIIYSVDGAGRSKSGLMVAISDDDGKTWQSGSLQLKCERSVCSGADPEAVVLPDAKIRLHYIVFPEHKGPAPGPNAPLESLANHFVYSATSTDGIDFTEESGVRFEYPGTTDPDVVKIGEKWFMYVAQGPRLVAASSTDGLTYTLEKTIREQGSVSNSVSIENKKWRQFFCDRGIRSATSSDGLTWIDDPGHRLTPAQNQIMCDPAPVNINGSWQLYYKAAPVPLIMKKAIP